MLPKMGQITSVQDWELKAHASIIFVYVSKDMHNLAWRDKTPTIFSNDKPRGNFA